MYKFQRYIYCAIIALLSISCDKVLDDPLANASLDIPESLFAQTPKLDDNVYESKGGIPVRQEAENWTDSLSIETRTHAVIDPSNSSEYFQYWTEGDALSVFFTTQNLKYTWQNYKDDYKDIGVFELDGNATEGTSFMTGYYYSIYPYKSDTQAMPNGLIRYNFPTTQHYGVDSYANGENGMIAFESQDKWDETLYFQNFCSYLQLQLPTDSGNKVVKRITLTSNNTSDKLTGTGQIMNRNNVPAVNMIVNTGNTIVLDCGNGVELTQGNDNNEHIKFWFVLPGGFTFTKGFSTTIVFTDNSFVKKATSKQISIERNHIKPMVPFDLEYINPTGPIRYKYHDETQSDPSDAFPFANGVFLDENGTALEIIDQVFDEETKEWTVLLAGELGTIKSNAFFTPKAGQDFDFTSYHDIESLTIDTDNEITIADFAFYNCTAETVNINAPVSAIGAKVLNASNITTVVLSDDVEIIKQEAFLNYEKLTSINLENVQIIETNAFCGCSGLTSINLENVQIIETNAFFGCSGLTNINLENVVSIGTSAFQNCTSLKGTITLPSTLERIGEGAFDTTNIDTVYCYATTPPVCVHDNDDGNAYIFPGTVTIYVPANSYWDYYATEGWWAYYIVGI